MYIGDATAIEARRAARAARPNLRDTVEQRRLERDAGRIERQQAADLRRVQLRVPLEQPGEYVTPSGGSPVVMATDAMPGGSGSDAGPTSAEGGSATVTVAPGNGEAPSVMAGVIPALIGAAALFLMG